VDGSTGEVNISISLTLASDGTHTYTTRTFIKASS
jgi:hypothetical protein